MLSQNVKNYMDKHSFCSENLFKGWNSFWEIQRLYLTLLLLLFFALPLTVSAKAPEENRASFPVVLMYHDIKTKPLNTFDVTRDDFSAQLDWLREKGYRTLSMEEFVSGIKKQSFPEKSVLITFDDGYEGICLHAAPELRKRNMHATFFIITESIDKALEGYPYITMQQLTELAADPLFSIGSHTMRHPFLTRLSPQEKIEELTRSKIKLETLTGRPVLALAYPYGDYDASVIAALKESGYLAGFAVNDRGMGNAPARYSIPRIYMGMELGKNNQKLFKKYVKAYKKMPKEAFAERFAVIQ